MSKSINKSIIEKLKTHNVHRPYSVLSNDMAICTGEFLLSTWHKLQSPGKRGSRLRNCSHQIGCGHVSGAFSWEGPAHCGRRHPWASGRPALNKYADWASHEQQAAGFPRGLCFCFFLEPPAPFNNGSYLVKCNKPFPPRAGFSQCFIPATETNKAYPLYYWPHGLVLSS